MSEAKLIKTSIISDIAVTKDDLIAIAVSEYEQKLLARESELESKCNKVRKELEVKQKELSSSLDTVSTDKVKKQYKDLIESLESAGFTFKTNVSASLSGSKVKYTLTLQGGNQYEQERALVNITKPGTFAVPDELSELNSKVSSLDAELKSLFAERLDIKKALNEVGRVERSAKAALAKSVLEQTEEGRQLIKNVELAGLPTAKLLTKV